MPTAARAFCVAVLILCSFLSDQPRLFAEDLPPYKRLLTGEDAKKASKLDERIEALAADAKQEAAAELAEELTVLRARVQGADHWEVVNARWQVRTLRQVAKLSVAARAELAEVERLQDEASGLIAQGQRAQAAPLLQKAAAEHRRLLGEEQPGTADAYLSQAKNLTALKKFKEAEPLYERAWHLHRRLLGDNHPDALTTRHDWAYHLNASGEFAKAEPLYQEALATIRHVHGEEHVDTAVFYTNTAHNLHALGKYVEAQHAYLRALDIRRTVLGEDKPLTATAYTNLGANLHAQGKYEESEPFTHKALELRRKLLGDDHAHTLLTAGNLASNLSAQGKLAEAEPLLREILERHRRALGEENISTAVSYNNLATNLHAQARFAEAQVLLLRTLELNRRLFGAEHARLALSWANIAVNLDALGKHAEAQPYHERALELRRKLVGEEHPDTLSTLSGLAACHVAQGRLDEGQRLHERTLALRRRSLGEDHPQTAFSYAHVANCLHRRGRYAEAEEFFRRALDLRRKTLGEYHPETAACYHNLASNVAAQRRHAEARGLYEAALERRRRCLGDEHRDTAQTYGDLACNYNAEGNYLEAERLWKEAAWRFDRARLDFAYAGLDRAKLSTVDTPLPSLAAVLARNGKPKEAWQVLEQHLSRGLFDDLTARQVRGMTGAERKRQQELVATLQRLDKALAAQPADAAGRRHERADLVRRHDTAQAEFSQFEADLARRHGPAAGGIYDLATIQKSLPADAAVVAWLDLEDAALDSARLGEHWACVVRGSGAPVWVRLEGRGQDGTWTSDDTRLAAQAAAACRTLPHQDGKSDWSLLEQLARQRLIPLESALETQGALPRANRLIILPSQLLLNVPIEVLVLAATRPEVSKQPGYWTQLSVSYAPSGTLFAWLKENRADRQQRPLAQVTQLADNSRYFSPSSERKSNNDGRGFRRG